MTAASGIRLASGRELPPGAAAQTFGVLGRKGSGRTCTAGVLAEGMFAGSCGGLLAAPGADEAERGGRGGCSRGRWPCDCGDCRADAEVRA